MTQIDHGGKGVVHLIKFSLTETREKVAPLEDKNGEFSLLWVQDK